MLPCEGNWESIFRLTPTRKLNKVNLVMNDGSFVLRELFHISICVTRFSPWCVEEKEALLDYVVRSDDSRQKSRKSSVFVRFVLHSFLRWFWSGSKVRNAPHIFLMPRSAPKAICHNIDTETLRSCQGAAHIKLPKLFLEREGSRKWSSLTMEVWSIGG